MMAADEVMIEPHRRRLNASRVADLRQTLRQHGLVGNSLGAAVAYRPSVGWVLIAGEHRWKAASAPGSRTEVIVLASWDDLVAWMAVDAADDRHLPWDPIAAVYFYEKAAAVLRPSRSERSLSDIAEFTGIHRGVLESVRWGRALIGDPDEAADVKEYTQALLDEIERGGEGGHTVRERVGRYKERKANQVRPVQSAAVQRKALESIEQLDGILDALLQLGEPNPDLPRNELEAYAFRLGQLGWKITKIKKNLRREKK